MAEISSGLLRRIRLDFPHHVEFVLGRLGTLDRVVADSLEHPERMLAAVVRVAAGRLDRLEQAMNLALLDWRDLLVAADFADEDWPALLRAWLDDEDMPSTAGPVARGVLFDADARRWHVKRRRLDLRIVKRLIRRADIVVMLGEPDGYDLRVVTADERGPLWEAVRWRYAGPGGPQLVAADTDYMGHEFTRDDGATMLYLEQRC